MLSYAVGFSFGKKGWVVNNKCFVAIDFHCFVSVLNHLKTKRHWVFEAHNTSLWQPVSMARFLGITCIKDIRIQSLFINEAQLSTRLALTTAILWAKAAHLVEVKKRPRFGKKRPGITVEEGGGDKHQCSWVEQLVCYTAYMHQRSSLCFFSGLNATWNSHNTDLLSLKARRWALMNEIINN